MIDDFGSCASRLESSASFQLSTKPTASVQLAHSFLSAKAFHVFYKTHIVAKSIPHNGSCREM